MCLNQKTRILECMCIEKEELLADKEPWQTTCDHYETDNREGGLPTQGGEKPLGLQ
jgi:hypothetical protein